MTFRTSLRLHKMLVSKITIIKRMPLIRIGRIIRIVFGSNGITIKPILINKRKTLSKQSKIMPSKYLIKIKRIGMLSKRNGIALSQQSLKNGKSRQIVWMLPCRIWLINLTLLLAKYLTWWIISYLRWIQRLMRFRQK